MGIGEQHTDEQLTDKIKKLEDLAQALVSCREVTVRGLRDLASRLDSLQLKLESKKKSTAVIGIVGAGLTLAGVYSSRVTGGAALGLVGLGASLAGIGCGVLSGFWGFMVGGEERRNNKKALKEADKAFRQYNELSKTFFAQLEKVLQIPVGLDIELQFKLPEANTVKTNPAPGIIICSGAMVSSLNGLGLLLGRVTVDMSFNNVTMTNVKIADLVENTIFFYFKGYRHVLHGSMMGVQVATFASGVVAVVGAAIYIKAFIDAYKKIGSGNPSDLAKHLRKTADKREKIDRGC